MRRNNSRNPLKLQFKKLLRKKKPRKLLKVLKRDQEITTVVDVVAMAVEVVVTTVEIVVAMVPLVPSELRDKSLKVAMMRRKKERSSAPKTSSVTRTRNSTLRMRRASLPFDEPLLT